MKQKQQGMTLIGMLLTMTVVIFVGIGFMRIIPAYLQHYEVLHAVKSLRTLPRTEFNDDPSSDAIVLRKKLMNQLYVNAIESIPEKDIKIVPTGPEKFEVSIHYQIVKPLISNVSLLFDFVVLEEVDVSGK